MEGEPSIHHVAYPGEETQRNADLFSLHCREPLGPRSLCSSRDRHGVSRVDCYPQIETQMRTETTSHTFPAEGRGGCGKPDFGPVEQALQETLTLTTYMSI